MYVEIITKSIVTLMIFLGIVPIFVFIERRVCSLVQGIPGRQGSGVLHFFADIIKFAHKEEVLPRGVHKWLYELAPVVAMLVVTFPIAVIPLCGPFYLDNREIFPEIFRVDFGIFYLLIGIIISSYGTLIAGHAANNKLSIMESLRICAQLISYELPLLLVILALVIHYQTTDLHMIVSKQQELLFLSIPAWGIFVQPIGMLVFLIIMFIRCNFTPLEIGNNRIELAGGSYLEYSSSKFALFMIVEYLHVLVMSFICVLLFLGGYQILPGISWIALKVPYMLQLMQFFSLLIKMLFVVTLLLLVKYSFPGIGNDQLMNVGWKRLFPLGLLNLIITIGYLYGAGR